MDGWVTPAVLAGAAQLRATANTSCMACSIWFTNQACHAGSEYSRIPLPLTLTENVVPLNNDTCVVAKSSMIYKGLILKICIIIYYDYLEE